MSLEFLITTLKDLLSAWPFVGILSLFIFKRQIGDILEAIRERIKSMRRAKLPGFGDVEFGGEVDPLPKIPGTPREEDIEDAEYTIILNPPELGKKNNS